MPEYRLSFTTGGLLDAEIAVACERLLANGNPSETRTALESHRVFSSRAQSAVRRVTREVIDRATELSQPEQALMSGGLPSDRTNLAWIATTRRYELVGAFSRQVLREKYLGMSYHLTHDDFDRFWIGEAQWVPALDRVKPTTRAKLRQNLFRMLREAGFLSPDNEIQPAYLSAELIRAWRPKSEAALEIFPIHTATAEELMSA